LTCYIFKGVILKKTIKIVAKIFGIVISVIVVSCIVLSIVHTILLNTENKKIVPNGILTEINGHRLHVYSEGNKNNKPTLVFMSGGGTASPVYDFKQLYSLFSDEYHIVIIEKIGYGYADIVNTDRDIDIVLEETREALQFVGENAPFVLFPHSMSGLEAFYWLSKYPEEITAIIGLDIGFPEMYDQLKNMKEFMKVQYALMHIISRIGLHRFYSMQVNNLTDDEYRQAKYLMYRNFMNVTLKNELFSVFINSEKVHNAINSIEIGNILLFSSNGNEIGDFWVPAQRKFAEKMDAELIILDCGHYIHNFESEKIARKSKIFLLELLESGRRLPIS
jgi:pimeloyl-ACP methyl ester carboxylesterase